MGFAAAILFHQRTLEALVHDFDHGPGTHVGKVKLARGFGDGPCLADGLQEFGLAGAEGDLFAAQEAVAGFQLVTGSHARFLAVSEWVVERGEELATEWVKQIGGIKKPAGLAGFLEIDINGRLGAFHVLTRAGIDLELLAGLDEERGLDRDAGFHGDGLLDVVGGVAADAFGGIGHRQDDGGGQFHGDGLFFHEGDVGHAVFHEILAGFADDFRGQVHGLEGFGIGEHVIIAVFIAELHLGGHHRHDFEAFSGAEADFGGLAGADAAEGGLHERAEVARGAVGAFEHDADVVIVADRHAFAQVGRCCGHKSIAY